MAPKRAKRAPSTSSSQADPAKPTRTSGRKRRHSDASNVSDRPSSSQSNVGTVANAPAKRRRKGKEPEVIVEEEETEIQVNEGAADPDLTCAVDNENDEEVIEASSSKHVHFGSGANVDEDGPSTASNITPHPRKLTIKRRITLSPAVGNDAFKRSKTATTSRTSLPAFLSRDDSQDATTTVQELQFAPLKAVIEERMRRRLRRNRLSEEQNDIEEHEKRDSRTQKELEELRASAAEKEALIGQLMLDLETQRQFAIDVSDETSEEHQKVLRMEAQLEALRDEFRGAQHHDTDMLDDDMMVLNSQEEVVYAQLPSPELSQTIASPSNLPNGDGAHLASTSKAIVRTERLSFAASAQASWDAERRRFEDAIMALSQEANDAKTKLQILEIELEALGFGAEGESSTTILESIRTTFARTRESLDALLPDSIPENCSTEDILDILTNNLESFADRLRVQDEELQNKDAIIADLSKQIQGLLDHLAEAEIRKNTLSTQWRELDESVDNKSREIEDLEAELETALAERDDAQKERDERQEEVVAMGEDHATMVKNVEKLTMSLENYRNEENRLTELITKMEQDHGTLITKMNQEREEAVGDLETRLDNETARRGDAERESDERQTLIDDLEARIETIEAERDTLTEVLTTTKADRDAEFGGREAAEAELDDKTKEVEELEGRVTRLEEELSDLAHELDELRQANETERNQREAAESDLDDRNNEIEDLNIKLRDQGVEANQLRQKLFEVQQTNQTKITELETTLVEKDAQYQDDIAQEIERRQTADDLAQVRAASITRLETRIDEIELEMRTTLAGRDARIAELEELIASRDTEIEDLNDDLRNVERDLDNEKAQAEERIEQLEGSITQLQQTIDDHEETISDLREAAINDTAEHNSHIEDRNTTIATINARVAELASEVEELKGTRDDLERRVNDEAEQMLQLQNEKADEIEALKKLLNDKQEKILNVEQKAIEADRTWQEVLGARDEEIAILKQTNTTTEETIETLTEEHLALQTRVKDYVKASEARFSKLSAAVEAAKVIADDEGEMLGLDGEALLRDFEQVDILGRLQASKTSKKITTTSTTTTASAKKGKGRKKRVMDSGIGLDADGDETLMAV